jgi:hypothetical protein
LENKVVFSSILTNEEILMRPRFLFQSLGLIAVLLTASCAPSAAPPADTVPQAAAPTEAVVSQATAVPVNTQVAEVQVVATSRGPNLEATDPEFVSLASGQLQLVEFFRFT